ncbi:MbtH family protein [Streptomyces sp. NPDC014734]|uniref:MbtH family protein n=1 Tax=Streptomyces sp. NPDC014734 TaxID=3364886 RepID=UPI0036F82C75
MSNPFESRERRFAVLQNEEAYHSLWPAAMEAPAGWRIVLEESSRQACLDYVTERGTDLRPAHLAATTA